ncbi:NAD(P)H-dependent oxidoreductase [Neisseria sp. 23W00296]|uniref:NAD(P)H-dependent oxidoreductase n=1 Tax=unclassified Neisseria TaxID=2623750 RepID=UPI003757C3D8
MALVILAHPDFQKSVANKAVIEHLKAARPGDEIRDIAALYPDFCIDAAAEQQALTRHQTVVFQYPMYWYNMPAILKQYFDSVFTYGFAYGTGGDKLKGRHFVPSITIGSPEEDYRADGIAHFRVGELCKNIEQTAYYTQMNYIDPFYFHGTSPALYTPEQVAAKAQSCAGDLVSLLSELDKKAV